MNARVIFLQSLFWPVLFFIAGIITSFYDLFSHLPIAPKFIGIALFGFGAIWCVIRERIFYSLLYCLSLSLLFLTGWSITHFQENQYDQLARELEDNPHPTGTIANISHFSKMDRIHIRLPVQHWWDSPHYFNINLLEKNHHFHQGQVISITKPLNRISSSVNPFTFQAEKYWKLQNTSHEIFLYNISNLHVIQDNPLSFIDKIRQQATSRIDSLYTNASHAGILKALLLGQKEAVSKTNKDDFKNAGLMHILAVSGLHVGIISTLLFILLLPVKLIFPNSWVHYMLVVMALWFYAALTGMNTPVVRAVILVSFYLTARRIDRQINKWNIYFWAVLLVLVIHPMALFTISFQLSFGAVAAILLFYSKFHEWVKPLLGQNYFSGLVAVSLAAQTGIFPILLYHFQEIALVSTVSSFLVIPLLFPLILITSISLVIPESLNIISAVLCRASEFILELITRLSSVLGSWEFSSQIWVWSVITIVLILIALILAGVHLEATKNRSAWLIRASAACLLFAGLSEGVNIFLKRNQPVIAIYDQKDKPIRDLYFLGVCYTNYKEKPPPYLIRNRMNYYIHKTILISDKNEWKYLVSSIRDHSTRSGLQNKKNIQVNDYIKSRQYMVETSSTFDHQLYRSFFDDQKVLASYNTY